MDRSKFHILEDGCQAFGVTLTEKQFEQFEKYYELLVEWNKVMNLTGIPAEDCLSTFAGDTFGLFEQKDKISG